MSRKQATLDMITLYESNVPLSFGLMLEAINTIVASGFGSVRLVNSVEEALRKKVAEMDVDVDTTEMRCATLECLKQQVASCEVQEKYVAMINGMAARIRMVKQILEAKN